MRAQGSLRSTRQRPTQRSPRRAISTKQRPARSVPSTHKTRSKPTIHTTAHRNFRIAVVGAAGGIGQQLSLLLKTNYTGLTTSLSLYDVSPVTPGIGADLAHIPTSVHVDAYTGSNNLGKALKGADIVVVPAGVPRKPGMTRDDLFNVNAAINQEIASAFAKNCPHALALIISNPVNSMVPLWAETLTQHNVYNPKKIMGVTSLDVFRANSFASTILNRAVHVPVVGGHAGATIIPLWSIASSKLTFDETMLEKLTQRVMFGGDEIVQAKGGAGSATLSMALAASRFVESCLVGLTGKTVTNEIAYVDNPLAQNEFGARFFASEIHLNAAGILRVMPTWERANQTELKYINHMIPDLRAQIDKGIEYAQEHPDPSLLQ